MLHHHTSTIWKVWDCTVALVLLDNGNNVDLSCFLQEFFLFNDQCTNITVHTMYNSWDQHLSGRYPLQQYKKSGIFDIFIFPPFNFDKIGYFSLFDFFSGIKNINDIYLVISTCLVTKNTFKMASSM